jgi:hypothetical protein
MAAFKVKSSLDKAVTITLLAGSTAVDSSWSADSAGDTNIITIPASMGKIAFITEDDWPALRYISFARLRIQAVESPTTGTIEVWVVMKR